MDGQRFIVDPEITPGVAATTFVTAKFLKALPPQATTLCTETFPVEYVLENKTEIEVVPCPDKIVAFAGIVQLYESAAVTEDIE